MCVDDVTSILNLNISRICHSFYEFCVLSCYLPFGNSRGSKRINRSHCWNKFTRLCYHTECSTSWRHISKICFIFLTGYRKKHLSTRVTNTIRAEIFAEQVFAVSRSKNCESRGILFHHWIIYREFCGFYELC